MIMIDLPHTRLLFQPEGMMSNMITKKDNAKVKTSVQSAIRLSFSRSEHYKEFKEMHRIEWMLGKRKRVSYKCAICLEDHSGSFIDVDHIVPLGKWVYRGIEDAVRFKELVYCSYDNLQILCKPCHKVKTKEEQQSPSFHNATF